MTRWDATLMSLYGTALRPCGGLGSADPRGMARMEIKSVETGWYIPLEVIVAPKLAATETTSLSLFARRD